MSWYSLRLKKPYQFSLTVKRSDFKSKGSGFKPFLDTQMCAISAIISLIKDEQKILVMIWRYFFDKKKNLTEEKKMKKINTLLIPLLHTKILLAPVQLKKWASKQNNFYDSDTSSRSTKKSLATVEVANHVCIAMTTKKLYYSTTKIGPKYTKITRQNHKELVAFISFQIFIQG